MRIGEKPARVITFELAGVQVADAWLKLDADTITDEEIRSWESGRLRALDPTESSERQWVRQFAELARRGIGEVGIKILAEVTSRSSIDAEVVARDAQCVARQRCADAINAERARATKASK